MPCHLFWKHATARGLARPRRWRHPALPASSSCVLQCEKLLPLLAGMRVACAPGGACAGGSGWACGVMRAAHSRPLPALWRRCGLWRRRRGVGFPHTWSVRGSPRLDESCGEAPCARCARVTARPRTASLRTAGARSESERPRRGRAKRRVRRASIKGERACGAMQSTMQSTSDTL